MLLQARKDCPDIWGEALHIGYWEIHLYLSACRKCENCDTVAFVDDVAYDLEMVIRLRSLDVGDGFRLAQSLMKETQWVFSHSTRSYTIS